MQLSNLVVSAILAAAASAAVVPAIPAPLVPGKGLTTPPVPGKSLPTPPVSGKGPPAFPVPGKGLPTPVPGKGFPALPVPGKGLPTLPVPGKGLPTPVPGKGLPALPVPGKGHPALPVPEKGLPKGKIPQLDPEVAANITQTVKVGRSLTSPTDGGRAAEVGKALYDAYTSITEGIKADIEGRKQFTQRAVANVRAATGLNAVICNVGYDTTPDTIPGFSTVKYTYKAKVGSEVTFDLLTFPMGMEFYRKGDGGYQNWAFLVDSRCKINGASVDCRI